MSAATVLRSNPMARQVMSPRGFRMEWVPFTFPTTDLTCTIKIPGFSVIELCLPQCAAAPAFKLSERTFALGTISASFTQNFFLPTAGVISGVNLLVGTTVATDAANIWTLGLLNKTQTLVPVNIATAANSNNSTGGSAFTAYTARALTLGNTGNKTFAANDVFEFTATKASSAANLVGAALQVQWTESAGSPDEQLYWADTLTGGVVASNTVTIGRRSANPTSALQGIALVIGR